MKSFRRVIEPKKSRLNPKGAIGGQSPDEFSRSESWPGEESSLISGHFARHDNDLDGSRTLPIQPMMDNERQTFPKPNLEKTAELRQLAAYLASTGFIRT
jgi:hypothetical protein